MESLFANWIITQNKEHKIAILAIRWNVIGNMKYWERNDSEREREKGEVGGKNR